MKTFILSVVFASLIHINGFCQDRNNSSLNKTRNGLSEFAKQKQVEWEKNKFYADSIFKKLGLISRKEDTQGTVLELQRFKNGNPLFYITNNLNVAKTISASQTWNIQINNTYLNGAGAAGLLWDGGGVMQIHQEFLSGSDSRIIQRDDPVSINDHSTHISGTMVARGIDEIAIGMAAQARIFAYDFNNDMAEIASEANDGSLVSNHSYGALCGWKYDLNNELWYWHGDYSLSSVEDVKFGLYDEVSHDIDYILWSAPKYVFIKSAGNDRNDGPESQPVEHLIWDENWITSTDIHEKDGGIDGYDCLTAMSVAKNVISVGSVKDLPNGYIDEASVVLEEYSSWGPTDDGRIKPDIVANGETVYSSTASAKNSYGTFSGTSMSAASITGTVILLHQAQELLQPGVYLNSSTVKGLLIHTANECGSSPGPDYKHGWGLANIEKAAELLIANAENGGKNIFESELQNTGLFTTTVNVLPGTNSLKATVCWTDPPATPPDYALNPTDKMLVNDLDIVVRNLNTKEVFYPWVLNPYSPDDVAKKGNNSIDNVEQVLLPNPEAGIYEIILTHKGILFEEKQSFSVIISGIETSDGIKSPTKLRYSSSDELVELSFESSGSDNCTGYNIYRQNVLLATVSDTYYSDKDVENNVEYKYYITAVYPGNLESLPTNIVIAKPQEPKGLPYLADFNSSDEEWDIKSSINGWRHGDSDSLSSYYLNFNYNTGNFLAVDSYTAGKGIHTYDIAQTPPMDLSNCENVRISFDYILVSGIYDAIDELKLVYKTAGSFNWDTICNLPVSMSWTTWEMELSEDIYGENVVFGLYYDDYYKWGFGAGLDNFSVTGKCTKDTIIDIVPIELREPFTQCELSDDETVVLVLQNQGENTLEAGKHIDIYLNINDSQTDHYTFVLSEPLLPDATCIYSIPVTYNFSDYIQYHIKISACCTEYNDQPNDTLDVTIENFENPHPEIINLSAQYCANNDTIVLNGIPSGGIFGGDGVTDALLILNSFNNGENLVTYEYTDENGCVRDTSYHFTLHNLPDVSILMADTVICDYIDSLIIPSAPAGGFFLGDGMLNDIFYTSLTEKTSNQVIYIFIDQNGCMGSDTVNIDIVNAPEITFGDIEDSICYNSLPIDLTVYPSGGEWIGSGVIEGVFYPESGVDGTNNLVYKFLDKNSCASIDSVEIFVIDKEEIIFTSDEIGICENAPPVMLEAIPKNGWFSGPGIEEGMFSPELAGTGSHTLYYYLNDLCNFDFMLAEVFPIPNIDIQNSDTSLCDNSGTYTITFTPLGGELYGDGLNNNIFLPDIGLPGTNIITYSINDENNCFNSDTLKIELRESPEIFLFCDTNKICSGAAPIEMYVEPLGGTFSSKAVIDELFYPNLADTGENQVFYLASNNLGCYSEDSLSIFVSAQLQIDIKTDEEQVCDNASPVNLIATPTGGFFYGPGVIDNLFVPSNTGKGNFTIFYDLDDNCSIDSIEIEVLPSTFVNIIETDTSFCQNSSAFFLTTEPTGGLFNDTNIIENFFYPERYIPGKYKITYNYLNGYECYSSDSIEITVMSAPEIIFFNEETNFCKNDEPVKILVNSTGGTYSGLEIIDNSIYPSILDEGNYSLNYNYIADNGCVDTAIYEFTVSANPELFLGNDTIISRNSNLIIQPVTNALKFLWSDGSTDSTLSFIGTKDILGDNLISLDVWNDLGCINSDTIIITVEKGNNVSDLNANSLEVLLYPNPSHTTVRIMLPDSKAVKRVDILDYSGKYIRTLTEINENVLDIEFLTPGLYFLKIQIDESIYVRRIIKE